MRAMILAAGRGERGRCQEAPQNARFHSSLAYLSRRILFGDRFECPQAHVKGHAADRDATLFECGNCHNPTAWIPATPLGAQTICR